MRSARDELEDLRRQHLLRNPRLFESSQGPAIRMGGSDFLNFSSNDYLGLAADPDLIEAAKEGLERFGTGAGASRLISGSMTPHGILEAKMAEFLGKEAALLFSSGFAAASGVFSALAGKEDVIVLDKLCHACLVDGARSSGATIRVFPHNDMNAMRKRLRWGRENCHADGRLILVTESVFSMDGDSPPLRLMAEAAREFGAIFILDEAHAFGVRGPGGRGLAAELGIVHHIDLLLTTLGKSAGLGGGMIASGREWIDLAINRARSFIFSTAIPPAIAHAGSTALDIIAGHRGDILRAGLNENVDLLAGRLDLARPAAAIIPLHIGDEAAAFEASEKLMRKGLLVPAVRYPTVARGSARLRVSLTAAHRSPDIELLAPELRLLLGKREAARPPSAE